MNLSHYLLGQRLGKEFNSPTQKGRKLKAGIPHFNSKTQKVRSQMKDLTSPTIQP